MKTPDFQIFGNLFSHVETKQKIVALTFDDAPGKNSDEILNLLNNTGIKATFFMVGKSMEQYPEAAKRISDSGNEMGNHSYSHQRMIFKSPSFIAGEIEKTDKLIRNTGYAGEIFFRPPFGKKLFLLPYYLKNNNRLTISWDIAPDSDKNIAKSQDMIIKNIQDNIKPGSIILLHPGNPESVKALPEIVYRLHEQGYQFVTISELLKYQNK